MPTTTDQSKRRTPKKKAMNGKGINRTAYRTAKTKVAAEGGSANTVDFYRTAKEPKQRVISVKVRNGMFGIGSKKRDRRGEGIRSDTIARAIEIRDQIAKLLKELEGLNVADAPKVVLQELHDEKTGRIDAQKMSDFMGVALKPLSEGLGLNYKGVHRNPSATGIQEALRPVKRVLELLHEFFGPAEAIRVWLNTPHPDLNGETALETLLDGKADAVELILENAWGGVPV